MVYATPLQREKRGFSAKLRDAPLLDQTGYDRRGAKLVPVDTGEESLRFILR